MFARVPPSAADARTWTRLICTPVFCLFSLLPILLSLMPLIGHMVNRELIEIISVTDPCCSYLLIDPLLGMERMSFQEDAREGVLSPDGLQTAVIRQNSDNGYELYVVEADGHLGEPLVIANIIADVAWSARGSQLAFSASFGDARLIYILDLVTGVLNQIVRELDNCTLPTWSPNERYIAFMCVNATKNMVGDLYISDLSLQQTQRILDEQVAMQTIRWSPDGVEIAFLHDYIASAIYTIHVDGSDLRRVSPNDLSVHAFAWSPDSQSILFAASQSSLGTHQTLYLIQRDGTGMRQLTETFEAFRVQVMWYP